MKAGKFPKPVKIGDRAVAWLQSDIQAWQDELIKKAQLS
jgi:predicted DNA-binding transcriptional regulator AlpA